MVVRLLRRALTVRRFETSTLRTIRSMHRVQSVVSFIIICCTRLLLLLWLLLRNNSIIVFFANKVFVLLYLFLPPSSSRKNKNDVPPPPPKKIQIGLFKLLLVFVYFPTENAGIFGNFEIAEFPSHLP